MADSLGRTRFSKYVALFSFRAEAYIFKSAPFFLLGKLYIETYSAFLCFI